MENRDNRASSYYLRGILVTIIIPLLHVGLDADSVAIQFYPTDKAAPASVPVRKTA